MKLLLIKVFNTQYKYQIVNNNNKPIIQIAVRSTNQNSFGSFTDFAEGEIKLEI